MATTANATAETATTAPGAIRLLIADDHRLLRESLRRSMTEQGFDVIGEAANGREAVEQAAALQPDVVLMDVTMPELDGVGATGEIRRAQPEVQVVMLTMHADDDVVAEAIRNGASGYLVKDCSTDEIAAAVHMAAGGQTAVSADLAASMLDEVRRLDRPEAEAGERVVTKREEEVLQLIADGCSTPEVAEQLFISQKTVKNHLASIYQKLDARDRTQAVLQAVRIGHRPPPLRSLPPGGRAPGRDFSHRPDRTLAAIFICPSGHRSGHEGQDARDTRLDSH